jgi:hypothetical protein
VVYFCPGMIVHYIVRHRYLPPGEFIEAVRHCPPQGSEEFMALMHDFGVWWDSQIPGEQRGGGQPATRPEST